MLIEYVKPGAVVANPVEAWNLNVDECPPVVRDTNFLEKRERIGNMLKHMPEDDSVRRKSERTIKTSLDDSGIIALISWIDSRYCEAV